MSGYQGEIGLGDTLDFRFTSRAFATGAPATLTTPTLVAYLNSSTTPVSAGVTLTPDIGGVTGLNHAQVVATSGNGFIAGNWDLVLTAGSVAGVSVAGEVVASFSIDYRSANVRAITSNASAAVKLKQFLVDGSALPAGSNVGITAAGGITLRGALGMAAADLDTQLDALLAAHGTTQTAIGNLADLDAAGVRAALGMAAADLDTQLGALASLHGTTQTAIGNLADLDAAGVRAALGMAAADLDTQLGALASLHGTTQTAIGNLNDLDAEGVAAAVGGLTVEGALTLVPVLRLVLAVLAGKLAGAGTSTITIRDLGDTKNRITATVDADGNRTAVTLDGA